MRLLEPVSRLPRNFPGLPGAFIRTNNGYCQKERKITEKKIVSSFKNEPKLKKEAKRQLLHYQFRKGATKTVVTLPKIEH